MQSAKTFFLLSLLTLLLVGIGNMLGGYQGAIIGLVLSFGVNFVSYWYSDKIVLAMYRAVEITENEKPKLYNIVKDISEKANLPMPRVYIVNEAQPNAFATGRNPKHAAVAVTTGIMQILTYEELSGVIGHEMAHIKNRDTLISVVASSIASAITYLAYMSRYLVFFIGGDEDGPNIFQVLLLSILGPIAALLIRSALSRSREFKADNLGAKLCGNPDYLKNALLKLEMGARQVPLQRGNEASANMFIVNPLSAIKNGGLQNLFSTHPLTQKRVEELEKLKNKM